MAINQTDRRAKDPATLFLRRIFQLRTRSCSLLLPGLFPPARSLTGPKRRQDPVRPGTDTGLKKNRKTMKFSMSSGCSVPPARLSTWCTVTASTPRALPRSQRATQCSGTSYGDGGVLHSDYGFQVNSLLPQALHSLETWYFGISPFGELSYLPHPYRKSP